MKKVFLLFLFTFLTIIFSTKVSAYNIQDDVYLGGDSIGLKLSTGVEIIGKYAVETALGKKKPWKDSNIESGDHIIAINNVKINSNDELLQYLKTCNYTSLSLAVSRNQKRINTKIDVVMTTNKEKSIGLYVRDKLLGVGTLSFVTKNNYYAALGHGIYDNNDNLLKYSGYLTLSTVASIKQATQAVAGEKRAILKNELIGEIKEVRNTGVYGKMYNKSNKKSLKIADVDEVEKGSATMYTVVNDDKIEEFCIEILETKSQSTIEAKGIKIKVNDEKLLDCAGGIVQGMSGSPIVQNGKLVGVISHVTLDCPSVGYAIYARWMYEELNLIAN